MTLREKLHAHIDRLPEAELKELAKQFATGEAVVQTEQDDLAETIALWEILAEPVNDEDARRELAEIVKRRPFFSKRGFSVQPE